MITWEKGKGCAPPRVRVGCDGGGVRLQDPWGQSTHMGTHVPQHSSTEVCRATWEAGASACATGTPTDTTRTGSGYTCGEQETDLRARGRG